MNACYILRINDVSDPHNHLYSVVYPDNWDQGEGLVAAHAADHGYSMHTVLWVQDHRQWRMSNDHGTTASAYLRRLYE